MTDFSDVQKDYLNQLFAKLQSTLDGKITETKEELKEQIREVKDEINFVKYKYENKILDLEQENRILKSNLIQIERRVRKNNIIIFGIEEIQQNIIEDVAKILTELLNIEISSADINDAYTIGKSKNKNGKPIIVEFISYQKKISVLKEAKTLKGNKIFIAHDQCPEDQTTRKTLYKHLKDARAKGQQAYIKGNRLIIDSEAYTVENLESANLKSSSEEEEEETSSSGTQALSNLQTKKGRLIRDLKTDDNEERQDKKKGKPPLAKNAEKLTPNTKASQKNLRSNAYKPK